MLMVLLLILLVFFAVAGIVWAPLILACMVQFGMLVVTVVKFVCYDAPAYLFKARSRERKGRAAIAAQDETQWGKTPWWESGRK